MHAINYSRNASLIKTYARLFMPPHFSSTSDLFLVQPCFRISNSSSSSSFFFVWFINNTRYAAAPTDDGTLIPATVPELCVVKDVNLKVTKGMRLLIRGPNGAGKSTLLKAITGALPLASGTRTTDDRLSLGLFAQDLAQELPGDTAAVDYVTDVVRRYDALIPDTLARSVMGALGLTGPKATRPIGTLSGGEKARVALATFCLTPHNLLLLDEPTNHLDQGAIESLLDALERYEGAVLVVSHDRSFCEAVKCTHVAYVSGGTCTVEERSLRESDWSETDKGHRALRPPVGSPEEAALLEATAAAVAAAKAQQAKAAAEAEAAAAAKAAAPPPPKAAKPKYVPEEKKKKKAVVFEDASSGAIPSVMQVSAAAAASQEAPAHYSAAKAKKDLERFEKAEKAAKGAKPLNKKQAKQVRDEYAGIEAAVEQCDAEALVAEQALADGKAQRLTFTQISELALAASAARRVAEQKMARWMELEEIMETLPSE
jgi:ABC-type multidrug transport system ATPase subunit